MRDRILAIAPAMYKEGVGARVVYAVGLGLDAVLEKETQAVQARMPLYAQPDALAVLAGDRLITPGLTEAPASLAVRLQHAFEAWQLAGLPRGALSQVLGFLLELTPEVRTVATRYDPSTYPPTRLSSVWNTYPAGRPPTEEPVTVYEPAGGVGDFDWDSLSQVTGSWGWWQAYVVIYAVAPNAWTQPAQAWGAGETFIPGSSAPYYSTISGDAWVLTGTYSGGSQAWGAGSTYTPGPDAPYYSGIIGDGWALTGAYSGAGQAWGVTASGLVGLGLLKILSQFKPENVWVRAVIVSFDATLFDPAQPADGTHNPAGTFGQWSTVSGDAWVETRFTGAVYGAEVV